jgi:release factor glutamine methyltransferase
MLDHDDVRWLAREKYQVELDVSSDEKTWATKITQIAPERGEEWTKDLAELTLGVPVAYLIGWVNFLGVKIELTQRTLVPRLETEFWVGELAKELEQTANPPLKILDLGCGSGCIGLALAQRWPNSRVTLVDRDPRAIAQTHDNAKRNSLENRVEIKESSWCEGLAAADVFDLIVTNPPYVRQEKANDPLLLAEPAAALFSGPDGLDAFRELIPQLRAHLKPTGKIYFECDPEQEEALTELWVAHGFAPPIFRPDQFGVIRWGMVT